VSAVASRVVVTNTSNSLSPQTKSKVNDLFVGQH